MMAGLIDSTVILFAECVLVCTYRAGVIIGLPQLHVHVPVPIHMGRFLLAPALINSYTLNYHN